MDAHEPPAAPPAIFVVGAPRSGTTLLRLMLDSHPHISCGPETHFLIDLEAILTKHWTRLSRFGFEREYWVSKMRTLFDDIHNDYASSRGKLRWADKTPDYGRHLPFVAELFPDARVIHVLRSPFDVVASHLDRWGEEAAQRAPDDWNETVSATRAFGRLHPDRYHEVRYERLVTETRNVLEDLLAFLDEPWNDAVLMPDSAPHDVPQQYGLHTAGRRAEHGEGSVYASRVGAGDADLSPQLRREVSKRCSELIRELGY